MLTSNLKYAFYSLYTKKTLSASSNIEVTFTRERDAFSSFHSYRFCQDTFCY